MSKKEKNAAIGICVALVLLIISSISTVSILKHRNKLLIENIKSTNLKQQLYLN